jgi:purine-nucleoside phosphorylase
MLILGSGLGSLADELEDAVRIPFADIPGFAPVTVEGHRGMVVAGTLEGVECVALQGRYHLYEGHAPEALTVPVRALAAIGARTMLVTNAAGGLNPSFRAGDLMVIDDHINLMWRNPLIGGNVPGDERFPDMSQPYDIELQELVERVASQQRVRIVRGVYCALSGPTYETPAEVRMFQKLGADAVGMSTVPEVLVARAMGLKVLGISLITNLASGLAGAPLSHDEVIEAGLEARGRFGKLVRGVLLELEKKPDFEIA